MIKSTEQNWTMTKPQYCVIARTEKHVARVELHKDGFAEILIDGAEIFSTYHVASIIRSSDALSFFHYNNDGTMKASTPTRVNLGILNKILSE